MGLFGKRARECDWCGRALEGDGIVDGELVHCSHACIEHKHTPASASARTVPDIRNATLGLASAELAIAVTELELYESIAVSAEAGVDAETLNRARNAYYLLWRQLASVRRIISARGVDLAEFDGLHRVYLDTAEVVDISRGPSRRPPSAQPFPIEDRRRARAAVVSLQRALAQLAAR